MSIMDIMEDIKHNVDAAFATRQIARVVTAYELSHDAYKQPSFERGCQGKANLGRNFVRQANRIARKRSKRYGVYRCPHCDGAHLTTKLDRQDQYAPLLHVTKEIKK
jgi:hypothetical protein